VHVRRPCIPVAPVFGLRSVRQERLRRHYVIEQARLLTHCATTYDRQLRGAGPGLAEATRAYDGGNANLFDEPAGLMVDLQQLNALIATTERAGFRVEVDVKGNVARVPPTVSRESYWIIQEALTNAQRHGGSPVTVRLRVEASRLEIEVGNPRDSRHRLPRAGRGLRSIRERVVALGGEMSAGTAFHGRWRLHVEFPLPGKT
jgi:hypothetical protein